MHNPYTMNSPTGKEILAWLREGDYAHPGEREALEKILQLCPVELDPAKTSVLDAGCGRGGTAQFFHQQGFASCAGFDMDADSIAYAQRTYPGVDFRVGLYEQCASLFAGQRFDLLVSVCVLYLVDGPQRVQWLNQLRQLASAGAWLAVFDYAPGNRDLVGERDGWIPLQPQAFAEQAEQAGWQVQRHEDIGADFQRWYGVLTTKVRRNANRIVRDYGHEWLATLNSTYGNQHLALRRAALSGGVWWCRAR